jgi:hypothetical protein
VVEPNIVVNTGASATIGTALAASTIGVVSSRSSRDQVASSASTSPSRNPATSPTAALPPVTRDVETSTPGCSAIAAPMALGVGSRNAGTPASRTTSSQPASASTPSATAGQTRARPVPTARLRPRSPAAVSTTGALIRAPCAGPRAPR